MVPLSTFTTGKEVSNRTTFEILFTILVYHLPAGLESANSRSTEGNRYLQLFRCGVDCIKPRESTKTVICLKTGSA